MTDKFREKIHKILQDVWYRDISADEALIMIEDLLDPPKGYDFSDLHLEG